MIRDIQEEILKLKKEKDICIFGTLLPESGNP